MTADDLTTDRWAGLTSVERERLVRWGDHAPCDRYPTDGEFDEPHQTPAITGVRIAFDPYKCELTADPAITRGGDGGGMICGGTGFFIGWLTLATSYFEPEPCQRDPAAPIAAGYTIGRRVLPLT